MRVKILLILMLMAVLPLSAMRSINEKDPKFRYTTEVGSLRPHAPLRFQAYAEEVNGVLQLSFLGNFSDVDIVISDADGSVVYEELQGSIYDGKTIYINPADGYPYDVAITSSSINIIGVIYLE